MHHLLAGLTSHSLVERVCAASATFLREDDVPIDWDAMKQHWLAKLSAKSELPHIISDGGGRAGACNLPMPSLNSPVLNPTATPVDRNAVSSSGTSGPMSAENHWRLSETRPPGSGGGRGVQGHPLRHMSAPPLFSVPHTQGVGQGSAPPKISYQYSSTSAEPSKPTAGPGSTATRVGAAGPELVPRDPAPGSPRPACARMPPRVVAVACAVPLHGTRVLVEMERGGGRAVQQFRVCRSIADADIVWCGKVLVGGPPVSAPLLPLSTSPLAAYCVPTSLPKRFPGGVLPVKVRNSSGEEVTLNWPFCRGPGQTMDMFEAALRGIRVINIDLPAILPSGDDTEDGSILSSIASGEFGEYETDMVLEAHRVFRFECPAGEAEPRVTQSRDTEPELQPEEGQHREETRCSSDSSDEDTPHDLAAAEKVHTAEFDGFDGGDLDGHAMNFLLSHEVVDGDSDSAGMSRFASVLVTDHLLSGSPLEESAVGVPKQGGSREVVAAGEKSLFDIAMGSSGSGEQERDKSSGGLGSGDVAGAVDSTEVEHTTAPRLHSEVECDDHCSNVGQKKKRRVCGEEVGPLQLQRAREWLARQLFLAEWEADQHLARTTSARRQAKFRIAGGSRSSNSTIDGRNESTKGELSEEDPTTIPLNHPRATVVGSCRAMVRHAEFWQVQLHNVHLSLRGMEYVAKTCKVRLKLPDYLSSDRRARKISTLS